MIQVQKTNFRGLVFGGDFNRSMQHLISKHYREEDVDYETTTDSFILRSNNAGVCTYNYLESSTPSIPKHNGRNR